ncbi:MAG TPA: VWA domain-containing protein [Terriglobia bacterium]|nr:VWA domain-containing protein [Terriglobia bacterium]
MLSTHIHARGPHPRLPSPLLAIPLAALAFFTPGMLKAQTTNPPEISSRDVEPAFTLKTERNLVMVRVTVRDAKGSSVETLRKEDFQLFDRGKPQTVLSMSLEKPAANAASNLAEGSEAVPAPGEAPGKPMASPLRVLGLYFDDVHTSVEGLQRTRDAADHYLAGAVQPGDRVGVFTASGQQQLDFTADLKQVHQALFALRPRPVAPGTKRCVDIPPYEAYLIYYQHDSQALDVAANDAYAACFASQDDGGKMALQEAQDEAAESFHVAEDESRTALRQIDGLIRHMAMFPGPRSVIIVSDGFLTETLTFELSQLVDRALRVHVVLNAMDARGLYTDRGIPSASESGPATFNGGQRGPATSATLQARGSMLRTGAMLEASAMSSLAAETGGVFFQNSNDYESGFRQTAGLPDPYYILVFSPQNLKFDGGFHALSVKLAAPSGLTVQARKGYYAPRQPSDPGAQEKEEIREAVFSQEEVQEIPIDVHTRFFMKTESDARITVLTRLDAHALRFRKEGDKSIDTLTFVTVLFDRDGRLVSGQQKSVDLSLRDLGVERLLQTGITMQALFDAKPGTYMVRAVVRDTASGEISSLNRTVEIPF